MTNPITADESDAEEPMTSDDWHIVAVNMGYRAVTVQHTHPELALKFRAIAAKADFRAARLNRGRASLPPARDHVPEDEE
jgi:hypothetical protein